MSTQSGTKSIKTNFSRILLTAFFLASVLTHARAASPADSTVDNNGIIRYIGQDEEMLMFEVNYSNVSGDRFMLEITEGPQNVLFKEITGNRKYFKMFRIPKEFENIRFVIRDMKDNSKKAYLVNTNSRLYYDVVINRVKN